MVKFLLKSNFFLIGLLFLFSCKTYKVKQGGPTYTIEQMSSFVENNHQTTKNHQHHKKKVLKTLKYNGISLTSNRTKFDEHKANYYIINSGYTKNKKRGYFIAINNNFSEYEYHIVLYEIITSNKIKISTYFNRNLAKDWESAKQNINRSNLIVRFGGGLKKKNKYGN